MKSLMSLLLLSVTVVGVCSSSSIDIDETMTVGGTERGAAVVGAAGAGTVEEEVMHGVVGLGMTGESQCSYFKNILVSSLFVFRCIYIHSLNTLTSCHSNTQHRNNQRHGSQSRKKRSKGGQVRATYIVSYYNSTATIANATKADRHSSWLA